MADLRVEFCGIKAPNPFWLASAPPTDKAYNVERAFRAGWGGVVWKTLGEDPPVVNVNGPRYGAIHAQDRRVIGFNNIELITDRPLDVNLREIKEVKKNWPDRALLVSLMVPCTEESWKAILARVEDTEADGVELNFGCPHGMSERGMGSAVGQVPEYVEMVARWCKANTRMPVVVKLTPNISDIRQPAQAAHRGGADAVSLINTINSIMGVDLDAMTMSPSTDGYGTHGGYCGVAVKPIALNMVAEIARTPAMAGLPISAIGGIETWRDAAEFMALGAGTDPGLHRRHGLRLQDRPGDDHRPLRLDGRQGLHLRRPDRRPRGPPRHRLAAPQPRLRRQGPHRPEQVHPVRPLPHRLRGHQPPGDQPPQGRQAALRGDRGRVRRLQPVRGGVPGGGVHHAACR